MRKKNEYSRIIQSVDSWNKESKGVQIQLFHHAVEKNIHSFYSSSSFSHKSTGNAFSESGLSRDEVQIIGHIDDETGSKEDLLDQVEKFLLDLKIDYLDLLVHPPNSEILLPALQQCRTQGKIFETAGINDYGKPVLKPESQAENVIFENFKLTTANCKTLTFHGTASEEVPKMLFLEGELFEDHQTLNAMAQKYDLSPAEFFYAWLFNHPANFHLVVSGGKEHMDSLARALHVKIIEQDWNNFPKEL